MIFKNLTLVHIILWWERSNMLYKCIFSFTYMVFAMTFNHDTKYKKYVSNCRFHSDIIVEKSWRLNASSGLKNQFEHKIFSLEEFLFFLNNRHMYKASVLNVMYEDIRIEISFFIQRTLCVLLDKYNVENWLRNLFFLNTWKISSHPHDPQQN